MCNWFFIHDYWTSYLTVEEYKKTCKRNKYYIYLKYIDITFNFIHNAHVQCQGLLLESGSRWIDHCVNKLAIFCKLNNIVQFFRWSNKKIHILFHSINYHQKGVQFNVIKFHSLPKNFLKPPQYLSKIQSNTEITAKIINTVEKFCV